MKDSNYTFSDNEYGKVLDNFVIACVDVAVIYNGMILLEKRIKQPDKGGWWIFGGRVHVGESLKAAAKRGLQKELGLSVAKERFHEIGAYNLIWPSRREPSQKNGCHHLLIAHLITIDKDEFQAVKASLASRTIEARWFDLDNPGPELTEKNILSIVRRSKEQIEGTSDNKLRAELALNI